MAEQYHIRCSEGDVGRYVLLPGDPGRSDLIAGYFENAQLVARNREFTTYTGTLDGIKVSVTSTGIGAPSTVIAVEELLAIGADTFIRVGTCGGLQNSLRTGDVVIALGAVRDEGTSSHYVPLSYPAVAHPQVALALQEEAAAAGMTTRSGIVISGDALYADLAPQTMPLSALYNGRWENVWSRANVLAAEMECAALYVVSSVCGARAGCVLTVVNSTGEGDIPINAPLSLDPMIRVAVGALNRLIVADQRG